MSFLSLLRPYKKGIVLTLSYIIVASSLSLVFPWGIKVIMDEVLIYHDFKLLQSIIFLLSVVLVLRAVFNFLRKVSGDKIGERIVCDLRQQLYWHIHKISILDIKKIMPAQILTRMTGDVESVRRFIFNDMIEFVYAILSVVLISIVLLVINSRLMIVAVVTLPLFGIVYMRMMPRLKKDYRLLRDAYGKMIARINEVLNGMQVVRSFTATGYEKKEFSIKQKEILKIANGNHILNASLWIAMEVFTSIGFIGVLWLGARDVIRGVMTSGELMAFYCYLGMLFSPLIRLVVINNSYQEASAALGRINDIMDIKIKNAVSMFVGSQRLVKGSVRFENVSFGYLREKKVLNNISFSVDAGETIGVVGASGVGKTTLANLLLRFFDPQEGEIYIDGEVLKDFDLNRYRRRVAVVLQDDYLFDGTIKDNICYGCFNATFEEIKEAALVAQAHEFIEKFSDGYDTSIGERGLKLSSGQRQRIAIARALLRKPLILILDEATSAIDAMMENRIQRALAEHLKEATIFIIAHRFSTIMEADKIIVLENGEIVEMGRHNHLLKNQGFYSSLYREQFKNDDEGSEKTCYEISS